YFSGINPENTFKKAEAALSIKLTEERFFAFKQSASASRICATVINLRIPEIKKKLPIFLQILNYDGLLIFYTFGIYDGQSIIVVIYKYLLENRLCQMLKKRI